MKCETIQSRLLESERPDLLPVEVAAHLKSCSACRKLQRSVAHLERNIRLVSVPPAPNGKAAFVRQFLAAELEASSAENEGASESVNGKTTIQPFKFERLAAALRSTLQAPRATLNSVPAPARRRIAFVLAASLLFLAFLFWANHGPHGPFVPKPADPLLAEVMDCDLRLAAANSPSERMGPLADLADKLQSRTLSLREHGRPEDLIALADLYEQVVRDGIVAQAQSLKSLPLEERARILESIANRLIDASNETEKQAAVLPESSRAPLDSITRAARAGDNALRELLREGRS
jgi:hypothetical protein